MFATKRLGKELQKIKLKLPPGIDLVKADDFREWHMDIRVLDTNPLYMNQIYRLVFIFPEKYPIEPPEVTFLYIPPLSASADANLTTQQPLFSKPPPQAQLATTSYSNPIDLTRDDTPQPTSTSQPAPSLPISPSQPSPSFSTARPIPIHPHIYSNGIICLDLLGTAGWSPVQSVESVCMSIQSMLTGNTKNERPEGDADFVRSMGPRGKHGWSGGKNGGWGRRGLKDVRFSYDDDTV